MEQVEFLQSNEAVVVKPLRMEGGEMTGWAVSRGGKTLCRARGGVRTFKTLCSVATLCLDNDIESFEVVGL